jgi:hypothetical protein
LEPAAPECIQGSTLNAYVEVERSR